jgi:Dolichyl-phosphate-mannose-protein mannosyltransferase
MQRALCAVAALALALLLLRAARVGLAGDYVDPVSRITAQDEALYAHTSIHMARAGNWLTPMFMGRFALYKPPLLYWMSGLSARIFGITRIGLRLPVAVLSSLAVGLVFLWAAELGSWQGSWQTGACAALLTVSNHVWHVLGGLAMTDGLLVAFYTAAMYCLFADPWLESRVALWGYAASVAAAILTKSVAGVLPLGMLAIYWLAAPQKQRPTFRRVCLAGSLAVALAAPWFVYQMAVHGRWFWMEHIRVEILGFGAGAPPQTSRENHALFYLLRIAAIDPVLTAFTLAAAPAFLRELRKRSAGAVLLLCWMAVPLAAALLWQYRNISYLLPMVPASAIVAAAFGPLSTERWPGWLLLLCSVVFAGKAVVPSAPWGLSFASGTVQRVAPLLSQYCEHSRANELIVVELDDDLYASALPLAKLRYSIVGDVNEGKYGMPFEEMGITLTASQFDDLARQEPGFRDKLRQWGIDSAEPIGTLIVASSPEELARTIRLHPASDFLVPDRYRQSLGDQPGHVAVEALGHTLLLSRSPQLRRSPPEWSCRL